MSRFNFFDRDEERRTAEALRFLRMRRAIQTAAVTVLVSVGVAIVVMLSYYWIPFCDPAGRLMLCRERGRPSPFDVFSDIRLW